MLFLFGFIIGFLNASFILVFLTRYKTPLERTIHRTESLLKPKGIIMEPEDEQVDEWVESLPQV